MKKRYLILAGILAAKHAYEPVAEEELCGTGRRWRQQQPTVTEAAKTDVVEMQDSTDETAKYQERNGDQRWRPLPVLVFTNEMNSTISAIYVRPTRDDGDDSDEDLGNDLVNGKFTLKAQRQGCFIWRKRPEGR